MTSLGRVFETVPELYDEVRPDYPDEVYDELRGVTGDLAGKRVLDVATGPGLAARQLSARGAVVVALDPGLPLLRRLRSVAAGIPAVAAVAESLPVRDACIDVVTCATAFHWLDAERAVGEVRRVVRPGGHLALWWANNRHGDGVDWEDAQSAVYERWRVRRGSRAEGSHRVGPGDAADFLRACGLEVALERVVEWERVVDRRDHLRLLRTHSDNLALGADLDAFIADVAAALEPWPVVVERLHGPLVVARVAASP